jgi:hypothetical protein
MQIIPDGCRTEADFRRHYIATRRRILAKAIEPERDLGERISSIRLGRQVIIYAAPIGPVRPDNYQPRGEVIYGYPIGPHHIVVLGSAPSRRTTAKEILRNTAAKHNLSIEVLLGHRRSVHIVRARHEAIYLISEETALSLPQIGSIMGDRDHTTILHAIRKWKREHPPEAVQDVEDGRAL